MKNFAIIGAAGYIAPRHMQAIRDTGNKLVAAVDKNDSVGTLDKYFFDVPFFTEIERFDRFLEKCKRKNDGSSVDFVSICTPNYLHDAHVRLALRLGADAVCEKPLVLTPWNIDALAEIEKEFGRKVYSILQLRLLPSLIELKNQFANKTKNERVQVKLRYITKRGPWYHVSWKGNEDRSGGIMTNIGIHFFDFLMWVFGENIEDPVLYKNQHDKAGGKLILEKADVEWSLSIDKEDLPDSCKASNTPAYRSITIDGEEIEFSSGFTDLHTLSYKKILEGEGFGLEEARKAVELVYKLRNTPATPPLGDAARIEKRV